MSVVTRARLPWMVGVGALVLLVIAAVWFFGGSEPDAVDLRDLASDDDVDAPASGPDDEPELDAADGEDDTSAPSGDEPDPEAGEPGAGEPLDAGGVWVVDTDAVAFDRQAGTGTFVGYRVDEELSGIGATTAVGRTPAVDGTVTIDAGSVTATEIVADLTQLTSDDDRRDGRVSTTLSPGATATFVLTEPITSLETAGSDEVSEMRATGGLTIEGVTREVTVDLQVVAGDGRVVVAGSTAIALSDFGVAAPSAPIVLSVSDEAVIEWQLHLAPA